MTCFMDMPRVDTGHRPHEGGKPLSRRRRQEAVEEESVEQPPMRPLGVPVISGEYADYICRCVTVYVYTPSIGAP